jgi:hypothetical protein
MVIHIKINPDQRLIQSCINTIKLTLIRGKSIKCRGPMPSFDISAKILKLMVAWHIIQEK